MPSSLLRTNVLTFHSLISLRWALLPLCSSIPACSSSRDGSSSTSSAGTATDVASVSTTDATEPTSTSTHAPSVTADGTSSSTSAAATTTIGGSSVASVSSKPSSGITSTASVSTSNPSAVTDDGGDSGDAPSFGASSGASTNSTSVMTGDVSASGTEDSTSTVTDGAGTTTHGGDSGGGGSSPCGLTSGVDDVSKILYVTPSGSPGAAGTSFEAALDLQTALAAVAPGELLLLQPGTYRVAYVAGAANTIELSKSGRSDAPLSVVAAECGRAILDFSFPEQVWVQDSYGFHITGDYWSFKGIEITRAGYQGAYVTGSHNTFENCAFYDNRNSGLEINKGGEYTTVINCDAYRNYDPKKLGGMADGFAPKQTQGPGNRFIGCRAWENSDDGFDAFDSPETVVIENSWAFRNGVDVWGYGDFSGNGNGFKLGGNHVVARNRITGSVAFGNVVKGFDQNNNAGGLTILNCTGYNNGTNFGLGNPVNSGEEHLLRNNVSLGASADIANADASHNSWDSGPRVSTGDFVSLDLALATAPRNPDGSLPDSGLFRLKANSGLIDAGVYVGLPFAGSAPDLGAFESEN